MFPEVNILYLKISASFKSMLTAFKHPRSSVDSQCFLMQADCPSLPNSLQMPTWSHAIHFPSMAFCPIRNATFSVVLSQEHLWQLQSSNKTTSAYRMLSRPKDLLWKQQKLTEWKEGLTYFQAQPVLPALLDRQQCWCPKLSVKLLFMHAF